MGYIENDRHRTGETTLEIWRDEKQNTSSIFQNMSPII